MGEIQVDDVLPGDIVWIKDREDNSIMGEVVHDGQRWLVRAFAGTEIVFAQDRNNHLGKRVRTGIRITGHTGQLV